MERFRTWARAPPPKAPGSPRSLRRHTSGSRLRVGPLGAGLSAGRGTTAWRETEGNARHCPAPYRQCSWARRSVQVLVMPGRLLSKTVVDGFCVQREEKWVSVNTDGVLLGGSGSPSPQVCWLIRRTQALVYCRESPWQNLKGVWGEARATRCRPPLASWG